ncbi:MAG: ROK family transcriptional regulator [Rectinemataceae bacterium]|nr:ROK family transcriptional regulator [Rectinemataceae bacterium]
MTRNGDSSRRTTSRVFRAVWRNPGISRIEMAKLLDLDKSTVTNQVGFLMEAGLVEELEEGEASSRGGRRPIQLSVRKEYGRIIGIEVQLGFCEAVVVDVAGEILGSIRKAVDVSYGNFTDIVFDLVKETEARYCRDSVLLGVGIGTAGLVNSTKGRIRYSVPLGIGKPLDFEKEMDGRLSVPLCIENDANCCAWGELAFNKKEDLKNFLFALVEYRQDRTSLSNYGGIGVGFGIVLNGKVHTGSHGFAGEFRSAFCDGKNDLQFSLPREDLVRLSTDRGILERTIDELSRNMAMLINTMDFSQVFIGGDIEALDIDLPRILRWRLEENWMYPSPKDVEIRYTSLKDKAVAYGAAGMAFERLLSGHRLLERGSEKGFSDAAFVAASKA